MKNYVEQLLHPLEQQIKDLTPCIEEEPIQSCMIATELLMEAYEKLRTGFINKRTSLQEEIDFFKHLKPKLTSKLIYFNEVFIIESNKPVASTKKIRKYYNIHLRKKELFFQENAEFYKYYIKGDNYLDNKFFVRNQRDCKLSLDNFYFQIDNKFATSHDFKVAQILAFEQLQNYLIRKLKTTSENNTSKHEKTLKWTASKVGIIELIYALHTQGVFNNGASDIRDIIQVFGKTFDVEIGQFHRTFYEIAGRKSEQTKFLNNLRESLIRKMNQMDEYKRLP